MTEEDAKARRVVVESSLQKTCIRDVECNGELQRRQSRDVFARRGRKEQTEHTGPEGKRKRRVARRRRSGDYERKVVRCESGGGGTDGIRRHRRTATQSE